MEEGCLRSHRLFESREEGYFTVRAVAEGEKEVDGKKPIVAAQVAVAWCPFRGR